MKPIVIWRTTNGYIVTDDDGWMNNTDIETCHVFNALWQVAKFIAELEPNNMKQKPKQKPKQKGTPKENNRHAYGQGHGTVGKKAARLARMLEREAKHEKKPNKAKYGVTK
jgi:hypothetical protein